MDPFVQHYQSLTSKASESEYDVISKERSAPPSRGQSAVPSEITPPHNDYDMITGTPNMAYATIPQSLVSSAPTVTTTTNVLYGSHKGSSFKHSTVKTADRAYQLSPVPESLFTLQTDEDSSCSKCSADAVLCIFSLLTILLSCIAISLVFLIGFGVIEPNSSLSSSTPLVSITATAVRQTGGASSTVTIQPSPTLTPEPSCNCPTPTYAANFSAISDSVSLITREIMKLRQSENMSVSDTLQHLYYYKYQINAINDSLQQLIPQTNQPRQPKLSGLNLTANILVNTSEGCTIENFTACSSSDRVCRANAVPFIKDNNIIVDFLCESVPISNSTFGISAIEYLYDPDYLLRCHCFGIDTRLKCSYTVHRCPYQVVGSRTATFTDIFQIRN